MNAARNVLFVMLMASSVFAADVKTVASVLTSGGFIRPPMNKPRGIAVLENGLVMDVEQGEMTRVILTLAPETLEKFQEQIDGISGGKLVDIDAGKGMCADAPITRYTIVNKAGVATDVKEYANCHQLVLQGAAGNVYGVQEVLNALDQLSVLR